MESGRRRNRREVGEEAKKKEKIRSEFPSFKDTSCGSAIDRDGEMKPKKRMLDVKYFDCVEQISLAPTASDSPARSRCLFVWPTTATLTQFKLAARLGDYLFPSTSRNNQSLCKAPPSSLSSTPRSLATFSRHL